MVKAPALVELEKEYDMIVDCTGFHRVYLPKMEQKISFYQHMSIK